MSIKYITVIFYVIQYILWKSVFILYFGIANVAQKLLVVVAVRCCVSACLCVTDKPLCSAFMAVLLFRSPKPRLGPARIPHAVSWRLLGFHGPHWLGRRDNSPPSGQLCAFLSVRLGLTPMWLFSEMVLRMRCAILEWSWCRKQKMTQIHMFSCSSSQRRQSSAVSKVMMITGSRHAVGGCFRKKVCAEYFKQPRKQWKRCAYVFTFALCIENKEVYSMSHF